MKLILIKLVVIVGTAAFGAELFCEGFGRTVPNAVWGVVGGAIAGTVGMIAWHFDLKDDRTDFK